jgi:hypothetical protein
METAAYLLLFLVIDGSVALLSSLYNAMSSPMQAIHDVEGQVAQWDCGSSTVELDVLEPGEYERNWTYATQAVQLVNTEDGSHQPMPLVFSMAHSPCQKGQLTLAGFIQHVYLGRLLRRAYRPLLTNLNAANLYIRTTNYPRTIQSCAGPPVLCGVCTARCALHWYRPSRWPGSAPRTRAGDATWPQWPQ